MTKRRLTRQQIAQQQKNQGARVQRVQQQESDILGELGEELPGLLIAHHGIHLAVESESGSLHHCKMRQNLGALVTGDRVIWRAAPDGSGIVVAVLERKSVLARPDTRAHHTGQMRPIAANIDLLVIVVAPKPVPGATTIDAYLVIAQQLGIQPLIVMNKVDLQTPAFLEHLAVYQALGYDWIQTSKVSNEGLDELANHLKNKTSVLVGQSGVGKSSLIRSLIPDADARVGQLCQITELGRHTTTVSKLYHLPKGGDLIDSPGIRRFGLWHLPEQALAEGFIEFAPYLGHCQFRNCTHQNERGCAIIEARDQGAIHPLRVQNFYELLNKHGSEFA